MLKSSHKFSSLTAFLIILSNIIYAGEGDIGYVENYDFSKTTVVDELFDGINKNNEVQVFHSLQGVVIGGAGETAKPFGASPDWKDVTGDGKPELVVGDGKGFLWIFPVTSKTGQFPPTVSSGKFVHAYFGDAINIEVEDFNNDGKNDVLVGTPAGAIQIIQNKGEGRFLDPGKPPSYSEIDVDKLRSRQPVDTTLAFPLVMQGTLPLCPGSYLAPRFVDWTGDGIKDLIVGEGSYSANSVYLYKNTGSNTNPDFKNNKRQWLCYGMGREHLVPAISDLDGDGDKDLLVGTRTGKIYFYENVPGNRDSDTPYLLELHPDPILLGRKVAPLGDVIRPVLIDLDNDNDDDLLIGAPDGRVFVSRNTGTKPQWKFDTPIPVKGIDYLKPRMMPTGDWRVYPRNSRNAAVILTAKKDGDRTYAHISFVDKFVDGDAGMIKDGGVTFKFDTKYIMSFTARGKGVKPVCILKQAGETVIVDGDTRETKFGGGAEYSFAVGEQWQVFSFTFSLPRLTDETKNQENTWVSIVFDLNQMQPGGFLDITDIKFKERTL